MDLKETLKHLTAYVPACFVNDLLKHPERSLLCRKHKLKGTALFADVSGFTPLSEQLSKIGREGSERLTVILNEYFTVMIEGIIHRYGGFVCRFGGDAMTIFFPAENEEDMIRAAEAAVSCALEMQVRMKDFSDVDAAGESFELKMKIGASSGEMLVTAVGKEDSDLQYVFAGSPLDGSADAEHHCSPFEVVADSGVSSLLKDAEKEDAGDGFFKILNQEPPASLKPMFFEDIDNMEEEEIEELIKRLSPFISGTIFNTVKAGQDEFVGEHRHITVLFTNFEGLDYDNDQDVIPKLQKYTTVVQDIVGRYGGRLNQLDTGDKGSKLIIIFGAPIAHENNEERAVLAALEMQNAALEMPFITNQRTGINAGYTFCGNVGSVSRKEYTIMGDAVNLSARLMQACGKNGLLASSSTERKSSMTIRYEELEPIFVKGKTKPIPIFEPKGKQSSDKVALSSSGSIIIGMEEEIATIDNTLKLCFGGKGRLICISGSAGLGKSRLFEELSERAEAFDFVSYGGESPSFGQDIPYLPWIEILKSLLGLKSSFSAEENISTVKSRLLHIGSHLEPWAPIFGSILNVDIQDSELTKNLDDSLRKQRLFDLTLELFTLISQEKPLLIVFESAQWMDSSSFEMLNYIARNISDSAVLFVFLTRKECSSTGFDPSITIDRVELSPMSRDNTLLLVKSLLKMESVNKELEDLVWTKSSGNPFFAGEVINSLLEKEVIIEKDGIHELMGDIKSVELPDTVEGVIMSRIDGLDERQKNVLKTAAVIGRLFRMNLLLGVTPFTISWEALRKELTALEKSDFTAVSDPAEMEYLFRHILTQEVSYNSLLFARRRELHEEIGKALEKLYTDNTDEICDILAHHYSLSSNTDKAIDFLCKAGLKAKRMNANIESKDYYLKAISLIESAIANCGDGKVDVYNRLMVETISSDFSWVMTTLGEFNNGILWFDKALEICDIQPELAALYKGKLFLSKGVYHMNLGEFETAGRFLSLSLKLSTESHKLAEIGIVKQNLAILSTYEGDLNKAHSLFLEAGSLFNEVKDDLKEGRALAGLANIQRYMGKYESALEGLSKSLELFTLNDNKQEIVRAYQNLATTYFYLGNYEHASEMYQTCIEKASTIGDIREELMANHNLGNVCIQTGSFKRALELLSKAHNLAVKIGDRSTSIASLVDLSNTRMALCEFDTAYELAGDALRESNNSGIKTYLGWSYYLLARSLMEMKNENWLPETKKYLDSLASALESSHDLELSWKEHYLRGRMFQIEGKQNLAEIELMESLKIIEPQRLGIGNPELRSFFFNNSELKTVYLEYSQVLKELKKPERAEIVLQILENPHSDNSLIS